MSKPWLVSVEWQDSQYLISAWTPIKKALKARRRVTCLSVGYVLADDDEGIVLASSVNGANALGIVCIPVRQIIKRRRVR